ncbi:hypothetical protein [Levilactobacillus tujiorum]|uniref:hypothetical protein n=1 Tax=Levilactobacillus tujiorum TaxID=2912243 RepID=UPI001456EE8E|nr:hypothetical protein [Levilactobacillus tujiorum]NLR31623.1 hypothetical protein [Levilactobacillus tujiorum]
MKKKLYLMVIAIALVVTGASLLGAPENASASAKWQFGTPKKVRGLFRTKTVKHHYNQLNIAQNVVYIEVRKPHWAPEKSGKITLLLMWRVPSRKLSSHLYQIKSVNEKGKHVRYYIKTFSHNRLKISKTTAFAHKPYYHRVKN